MDIKIRRINGFRNRRLSFLHFVSSILAVLLMALMSVGQAMAAEIVIHETNSATVVLEPATRRFARSISIHPNGQEWLISELVDEPSGQSGWHLLRYDMANDRLYRYQLPEGYIYEQTRYSERGDWVVMTRSPRHDGTPESAQRAFMMCDFVLLNMTNRSLRIIPVGGRFVTNAVLSPDLKRIAYWSTELINLSASTRIKTGRKDLFEYDLELGRHRLFAGPYQFGEGGRINYVDQDTLVVGAWWPREYEAKESMANQVYTLRRGMTGPIWPEDFAPDVYYATYPSFDSSHRLSVYAHLKTLGMGLFSIASNRIDVWKTPYDKSRPSMIPQVFNALASPTGDYLVMVYTYNSHDRMQRMAFALLDFKKSLWRNVAIPAFETATVIPVTVNR